MKNSKITKLLVSFMAVVLLLASCGGGKKSTDNTLRLASLYNPSSINSILDSEAVNFQIISNITEGLLTYDEDQKLIGSMAESWETSADGKTYTFKLRDGLVWANDTPLTANDFVFSWGKLATSSEAAYGNLIEFVKNGAEIRSGEMDVKELGVEAKDDQTLVVTLEEPLVYFDALMAFAPFFPINEAFYNEVGGEGSFGTNADTVLANGPYVLKSYDPNLEYTMVKNEKYWNADKVAVDTVETRIVTEASTQAALYDKGEIDRLQLKGDLVEQYDGNADMVEQMEATMFYMYLSGLTETPAPDLNNQNLRAAVAHAIDKEVIVNQIFKDGSIGADYVVPKDFAKLNGEDYREYSGNFNDPMFDVTKAQEYLEKAKTELGKDTIEIELALYQVETAQKMNENIKSQIETNLPGVKVTLNVIPQAQYYKGLREMKTPAANTGWGADYIDIATYFSIYLKEDDHNYGQYANETYNTLVADAEKQATPEARWDKFVEAEKVFVEDYSTIPLYQRGTKTLINPRVKGYKLNPTSPEVYFKYITIE